MEKKRKKRRRMKTSALCMIAGLLVVLTAAVFYIDTVLLELYRGQQQHQNLSTQAAPIPVLQPTPTPDPTPVPEGEAAPTPAPTRAPLPGDILSVNFPDYDTGENALYSHQSDELRIAVYKVQETGVTYFLADVWMRNISCFRTAFSSGKYRGKREDAEKISQDNNAILAVNGDFLGGLTIRNGVRYQEATDRPIELEETPTPGPVLDPYDPFYYVEPTPTPEPRPERSTCVLYADGRMVTEEYETFRTKTAMQAGAWQGWQYGPTLVRGGVAADDVNKQGRNPRCVLGYYEPGHYCLILVDGRQKDYSVGMNYEELIDLCMRLGLTEAYNMDGGGSAVMTFKGKIINSPSGGAEGRKLPDMVTIGSYLSPDKLFAPTPSPASQPETTAAN